MRIPMMHRMHSGEKGIFCQKFTDCERCKNVDCHWRTGGCFSMGPVIYAPCRAQSRLLSETLQERRDEINQRTRGNKRATTLPTTRAKTQPCPLSQGLTTQIPMAMTIQKATMAPSGEATTEVSNIANARATSTGTQKAPTLMTTKAIIRATTMAVPKARNTTASMPTMEVTTELTTMVNTKVRKMKTTKKPTFTTTPKAITMVEPITTATKEAARAVSAMANTRAPWTGTPKVAKMMNTMASSKSTRMMTLRRGTMTTSTMPTTKATTIPTTDVATITTTMATSIASSTATVMMALPQPSLMAEQIAARTQPRALDANVRYDSYSGHGRSLQTTFMMGVFFLCVLFIGTIIVLVFYCLYDRYRKRIRTPRFRFWHLAQAFQLSFRNQIWSPTIRVLPPAPIQDISVKDYMRNQDNKKDQILYPEPVQLLMNLYRKKVSETVQNVAKSSHDLLKSELLQPVIVDVHLNEAVQALQDVAGSSDELSRTEPNRVGLSLSDLKFFDNLSDSESSIVELPCNEAQMTEAL